LTICKSSVQRTRNEYDTLQLQLQSTSAKGEEEKKRLERENNTLQLKLDQAKREIQELSHDKETKSQEEKKRLERENNTLHSRLEQATKEIQDAQIKYQNDLEIIREQLTNEMEARNSLELAKEQTERVHSDWKTTLRQLTSLTEKLQTTEAEKQKLSQNLEKYRDQITEIEYERERKRKSQIAKEEFFSPPSKKVWREDDDQDRDRRSLSPVVPFRTLDDEDRKGTAKKSLAPLVEKDEEEKEEKSKPDDAPRKKSGEKRKKIDEPKPDLSKLTIAKLKSLLTDNDIEFSQKQKGKDYYLNLCRQHNLQAPAESSTKPRGKQRTQK